MMDKSQKSFGIEIHHLRNLAIQEAHDPRNFMILGISGSQKQKEGFGLLDAAFEAAKIRLRPIIMTSLAFTLGTVPLAISSGAGAASRHAIGTGVIGGMLAATFIAIIFIPLFYVLVSKLSREKKEEKEEI